MGHTVRAVSDVEDLKTVEPSSVYKVPLICDCVLELQFLVNPNQVGTSRKRPPLVIDFCPLFLTSCEKPPIDAWFGLCVYLLRYFNSN